MMPDGTFAIAIPQAADLFRASRNTASRDFKRLMGEDFKTSSIKTEFNRNATLAISLSDFEHLLIKLDRSGNAYAQEFRDSLASMALHQLFCDAFNIKFEKLDRQNWLKERQDGKFYRRSLTDATKLLIDQGETLNYGYITLETYGACGLLPQYRGYKKAHKDNGFRNTLDDTELRKVSKFEELTADFVMVDRLPINQAMAQASRYIR